MEGQSCRLIGRHFGSVPGEDIKVRQVNFPFCKVEYTQGKRDSGSSKQSGHVIQTSSGDFHLPLKMKFVTLNNVNAPEKVSREFVLA